MRVFRQHVPLDPATLVPPYVHRNIMPSPEHNRRRIPGYGSLLLRRPRYQCTAARGVRQARHQVRRQLRSVTMTGTAGMLFANQQDDPMAAGLLFPPAVFARRPTSCHTRRATYFEVRSDSQRILYGLRGTQDLLPIIAQSHI